MGKNNRQRRGPAATAAEDFVEQLLDSLWGTLSEGDLLQAELATARCLALSQLLKAEEGKSDDVFIDMAAQGRKPEDAALLRLIVLLGSPAVKRKASRALAVLTADDIYPPEWVAEAGKASPLQAWRRYDAFGDEETIVVRYGYEAGEHAIAVELDLTTFPSITSVELVTETGRLADDIAQAAGSFERHEEISLAEARRRIEPALTRSEHDPDPDTLAYLPIVRSRLRRLPAVVPPEEGGPAVPVFTAADRAAAVAAFMSSPEAARAVAADEAATRFWAEVLTGYSSRLPGEPPGQVGPIKLRSILHGFVPDTYTLTEPQRRHLEPAVTAWARWSAEDRGLDEEAAERLTGEVPGIAAMFDRMYDGPIAVTTRGYLADLATSDADVTWLDDLAYRRSVAMPLPGWRDGDEQTDALDASDPAGRRAYAAAEFGDCDLPAGVTRAEFVSAAHRVIEELWRGDPPATWERAQRLLGEGRDRHDVIHALTR